MAPATPIADLLLKRSIDELMPLSVMVELTHRCNLRCRHCYLEGLPPSIESELSTEELVRLLDELVGLGTLSLVLSGGEILLRRDLRAILEAAAERGFALRLFTNATLLDEDWAAYLGRLGTASLDVSIHGATAESHDWMTRCRGSFDAVTAAVRLARAHGVPVALKVPLTRRNAPEREAMRELGGRLGAPVRFDPVVTARHSGARDTLDLRLSHEELVDVARVQWPDANPAPVELTCTAGVNSACITPEGVVRPCVQLLLDCGRLREAGFAEIWGGSPALRMLRGLADKDIEGCTGCSRRLYCNRCPALALLEDGDLRGPSTAACQGAVAWEEALADGHPRGAG